MLLSLREANRQRAQDLFQAIQEQTLRQDQAQGLPEAEQRRDLSLPVSRQIGRREAIDRREAAAATGLRQHLVRGETDLREATGLRDRQADIPRERTATGRPEETEIDRPDLREETTRDLPLQEAQ